ncbi:Thymidylate synthase ThyX [Pelotomaculum schinkii]|uniref:FAD-dependent thymidylate synthase n=1 Tax=Pelotomaculum schinkii TaxID=78350 RepID=A0A4Y7RH37_9FIRM|nr:FAD-dependent thymidylate synthase [Pelotomaculum schinkii]TEB08314.1 Thymidylate synthase ThyX [Pelotomaculum schinkii]
MPHHSRALIIAHTPEPEKICTAAARISTKLGSSIDIFEEVVKSNNYSLISKVLDSGHKSFIEHVNFTIAFENVSAFVEQFIIEFRLASFTVKSRRYVDFGNMGYYIPKFRLKSESTATEEYIFKKYTEQMNYLFMEYKYFVNNGIIKEDARFLLPYCYFSNFYCTVNARELMHIIYSAKYGRGSGFPEINKLGESLLLQASKICPSIFNKTEQLEAGNEDKEFKLRDFLDAKIIEKSNSNETTEIISYTNDPEKIVALTAIINHKLCSTNKASELIESDASLHNQLLEIVCNDKRKRELEQINFTFRINNISLAGLTHLVRHRMQSLNVPSFTEFGISDRYIIPNTIASNPTLLSRYHAIWKNHIAFFNEFHSLGIVDEDLVYLYLSGNVLDVVTTMNARELFHFIQLRSCNRAQWEIRLIAIDMLRKLRRIAPNIFGRVGPACFMTRNCPEGRLSCGKMQDVYDSFSVI